MSHVVFIKPHSNSSLRMNKMISGSQALVVGGTSGIGYAIAKRLAKSPNYQFSAITIVGRTKPTTMPENLSFRAVDASSMKALKDFARDFRSQDQKLDLLVMTQGILTMAGRTETPEGIDKKMALHFYGKQLLIRELGPIMSPDAKVMIVLDGKNGDAKRLNWEDLDLKNTFSLATAANHCITMSDAMVQHHAVSQSDGNKRFFTHAYPGVVDTATAKNSAWYFRALSKVVSTIAGSTPDECAERLLDGMYARAEEEAGKDVFWSCIDNHGKKIEGKKVWTAEEMEKIANHTWAIVDGN